MTQEELVKAGWVFMGYCGKCRTKKEYWTNPKHENSKLTITRRRSNFAFYENNFCTKAGDFDDLKTLLTKLNDKEAAA